MKNILLHGLPVGNDHRVYIAEIINRLQEEKCSIFLSRSIARRNPFLADQFQQQHEASDNTDFVLSLGGDGTFLESLLLVGPLETPILGINIGRLGFLASISKEQIKQSLDLLFDGKFEINKRSLLEIKTNLSLFEGKCYALNECAILRKDTSSMIITHCYINDEFLNTYWADGLMVSTPTGSTGYSLSCGGPLMMPDSKDFVITPVSPHNLNVRPLIISDDSQIRFAVESRDTGYLVSLDSRSETVDTSEEIIIRKAAFKANVVLVQGNSYSKTIRNKLGWGFDRRN
ncbi:MAG: NAD kinase [Bacteroidota bacterium]